MSITSNDVKIKITSRRKKNVYVISNFVEYQISMDLKEDCDTFSFSIGNLNGKYSGYFSMFDKVHIYVGGNLVMVGRIDSVDYKYDLEDDIIVIEGRDMAQVLVDNQRAPVKSDKKKKTNVKKEIKKMCKENGVKCGITSSKIPAYKGYTVGCNESYLSVMQNLLMDTEFNVWFSVDTLHLNKWNVKSASKYTITSDMIESISYKEDGKDIKTKIVVYTTDDKGKYHKKKTIKNASIHKVCKKVSRHKKYSDTSTVKVKNAGLKKMKEGYMECIEVKVKVKPNGTIYMPNTCVHLKCKKLGIDDKFFVRGVEYFKDYDKGTEINLTLTVANTTYNKAYKLQDITHEGS